MLLSSIKIQGFKSFADKTVLKFGKGITAVVGPNGSGKSNISDAVRWVLGEQSTKSLRGQSMEDVIFGGTESRKPHGYCEVTLNINNTDRSLDFDNDFVSITRRFYRSHESEYLINNVAVRLKDINELFMDTGLGRDGYSMIGQGKIDNIISSKSSERRDIFEEASGISKYRYRKIEAERRLNDAEENLIRLKDIMSELESRVGPLEEQSKKAEKFLKLSDDKKQIEIGLWLYTLDNSKNALRAQESKIDVAQMQYKEIEQALSEFDSKMEQNAALFAKYTSDIEGERQKISSTHEELATVNGKITVIKNDIQHNKDSILRLSEEEKQLNSSDSQALQEIEDKHKEIDVLTIEANEASLNLNNLEKTLSSLILDSEGISKKIEDHTKKLNILSSQCADKRVEMVTADTTIDEIKSRLTTIDDTIQKQNNDLTNYINDFENTNTLLDVTNNKIEQLQNSLNGYSIKMSSAETKFENTKLSLDTAKLDLEAKKRRVMILKELENNMEGFNHSVKSVMSQANKGLISGVHGPVSKIVKVEKKYSVAIETALGNAIQNIVVDTEGDAKKAITYLKTNRFGRATFLPISSITAREFKEHGFENMLGYVGIAADLVTCDDKYSQIIKYLLGGAVVAEDINSAVAIAKKFAYRIKVVSLDGQVINPGGSLTGGSLVKNAGLLSRNSDIKKLEDEIIKETESNSVLLKQYDSLNFELEKMKSDILSIKSELTTLNEDKIRVLAELHRLEELKNNLQSSIDDLQGENKLGLIKIEKLKVASSEAARCIIEFDNSKETVQAEIDNMSGGRIDITKKREALTDDITNNKLRIIEINKDIDALKASADNLENMINSRSEKVQSIKTESAALILNNDKLLQEIDNFNNTIDSLNDQICCCEKNIQQYITNRNNTEKIDIELRSSERERTAEREKISSELARLTEHKNVMVTEYDNVIRQLYDEYQLTRSEAEAITNKIEKPADSKKQLAEIKSKIRYLGNVNVSAIEEFKEVNNRYLFMSEQINDVEKSRSELHKLINQLTTQMQEMFTQGFEKINNNFKKTFSELFGGGYASLSLSNPEDVLESGIDIDVKLPGKNVPSLDGLSGGEKALIALSIYFAIMRVNAPPFCFLDEVDTALDDINVERFADYMSSSDFSTQFICVTHRRGTMEAADMLYGVTMQEKGVTKLLELNVKELEKKLLA